MPERRGQLWTAKRLKPALRRPNASAVGRCRRGHRNWVVRRKWDLHPRCRPHWNWRRRRVSFATSLNRSWDKVCLPIAWNGQEFRNPSRSRHSEIRRVASMEMLAAAASGARRNKKGTGPKPGPCEFQGSSITAGCNGDDRIRWSSPLAERSGRPAGCPPRRCNRH